jgi:predicted small lipoprotein YifL
VKSRGIALWLLSCCLLLTLSGCGNKGPLELPDEEDERQKTRSY